MSEETANSPKSSDQLNEAIPATQVSSELRESDTWKNDEDELKTLQREKLRAEIADLKKKVWQKIIFWPPFFTFLISLMAYGYFIGTGTFDAKQAHLTYITDTLRTYKNHLDTVVKIQNDSSKILTSEIHGKNGIIDSLYKIIGTNKGLVRQYDSALKLKDSDLSKKSPYVAGLFRQIKSLQDRNNELQRASNFYSENSYTQTSFYASSSDCKMVDITKIPGYSNRSRYFNMDRYNSFILSARGFGIYQGGGPDGYTWDSVKQCQGKYVMYFTKGRPQEAMPNSAAFEFDRHHVTLLNQVGILNGRYDLIFDFEQNKTSNVVPKEDVGSWRIFSRPNRIIIHENKMIEFGDSAHLQQYRVQYIKIDRIDNSVLYITYNEDDKLQQQFLVKHGLKKTIILFGPDRPEAFPFCVMSKL